MSQTIGEINKELKSYYQKRGLWCENCDCHISDCRDGTCKEKNCEKKTKGD